MNEHREHGDRAEEPILGRDIEADSRREIEAAEASSDEQRLAVLERLYKDLEGALES
jgi:hypothetical protein